MVSIFYDNTQTDVVLVVFENRTEISVNYNQLIHMSL